MPFKSGVWGPDAKKRSKSRREYFRAYQRELRKHQGDLINKRNVAWQKANPEKVFAQWRARWNVHMPTGQLCEVCGIVFAECKHHPDYDKPYEVQFLCNSCHRSIHGKRRC